MDVNKMRAGWDAGVGLKLNGLEMKTEQRERGNDVNQSKTRDAAQCA